jgi:hypothetical protein
MGPLLVNTKQKVAALASGLAIATTGLAIPAASPAGPGDDARSGSQPALSQAPQQPPR